jgi:NADH dehydrogenase
LTGGLDVVTGAFSFTGRFIAQRLIEQGRRVRTLTNHPERPGAQEVAKDAVIDVAPLQFTDRAALVESLRGVDVLYNTYWVRFPHGGLTFGDAIANTRILVGAAAEAGVRKVVHISVSNPSIDSHLEYYAGKARTEAIIRESQIQWAIVRPTLVYGAGDILINNIAWLLRRMPLFGVPRLGGYRLQPVAGEDVAEIATWASGQTDNVTVDAAGPDILTYVELVEAVAIAVRRRPRFVYLPLGLTLLAADIVGRITHDVLVNRQELQGLMDELLVSKEAPRGTRHLDNWLLTSSETLGKQYTSELGRHFR